MGTENIYLIILGGFGAFISNAMYAMGGTSGFGLLWRRWIGSFVLSLASCLIALFLSQWDWRYLLFYPILSGGYTLPYGASTTLEKVVKRFVFALAILMTCLVGVWICEFCFMAWVVFGLAFFTAMSSIVLGVINPFNNAPLEQFLISTVLTLYVPWFPFITH